MLGVELCCFFHVVPRVVMVPACRVSMMRRSFMIARFMMLRRFAMMPRRVLVVFRCFMVMLGCML